MQIKIKDKNGIVLKTNKKYCKEDISVTVETEELNIVPGITEQINEGLFNKVTVAGDSDLVPENIKQGVEIFGIQGNAKTTSAKITDASYLFHMGARMDCLNELLALCENVTNMSYMFYNCYKLTELDLSSFDTSKVTNMNSMFNSCNLLTTLDLKNFDTSKVTNMANMFSGCSKLTSLNLSNFDTSNVTTMSYMFNGCTILTSLDLSNFNTSQVTNMSGMFSYSYNLTDLVLNNFDMSKVTNVSNIFTSTNALTNLKFGINLGKGYTQKSNNYSNYKLDLSYSTKLTHESLMNVINNLYDLNLTYDVANGGTLYTQTLNLGSTNLAKLTEEEIAIATSKGWNVT